MKIALIDIKSHNNIQSNSSTQINYRNMNVLSRELGADFYYSSTQYFDNGYDVLIFGFGSMFTDIEATKKLCQKSNPSKIYFLVGEYEQSMNPALYYVCKEKKMKFDVIQNIEVNHGNYGKLCKKKHVVDINMLIKKPPNKIKSKKYDCIYYGRWRPGRAKYLREYLNDDIYISSDTKNLKKYKGIGCTGRLCGKLSWTPRKETLNNFRYSLYLEDEYTHNIYNHLANRWYEAETCNNVIIFDSNCMNTITKSHLKSYVSEIEKYCVCSHNELIKLTNSLNKNFEKHLEIQTSWRKYEYDIRDQVIDSLKAIILK